MHYNRDFKCVSEPACTYPLTQQVLGDNTAQEGGGGSRFRNRKLESQSCPLTPDSYPPGRTRPHLQNGGL